MGVLSGYLFRNRNTVVIICGLSIECESSHQLVWKHFKEVIQYNMNKRHYLFSRLSSVYYHRYYLYIIRIRTIITLSNLLTYHFRYSTFFHSQLELANITKITSISAPTSQISKYFTRIPRSFIHS